MTEPPGQTGWIKDPEESARVAATLKPPTVQAEEHAITAGLVDAMIAISRALGSRRVSEKSLVELRGHPSVIALFSAGGPP